MRSKRRWAALAVTCVLALSLLAGCSDRGGKKGVVYDGNPGDQKTESTPEDPQGTSTLTGVSVPLVDRNITTVRCGDREYKLDTSYMTAFAETDCGVVYNMLTEVDPEERGVYTMEFYLMDPKTGEKETVARVDHVGWVLCNPLVVGKKVFFPLYEGKPFVFEKPVLLLEIDVETKTAKQYRIVENGFWYGSITEFNNRILLNITETTEPQRDRIFEFNPAIGEVREVLSENLSNQGASKTYRGLDNDNGTLCVLTVRYENDVAKQLVIERYDSNYRLVAEWDISDILRKFAERYAYDEKDIEGEMRQFTYGFEIIDGRYLYYENGSMTMFTADLGDDPEAYFTENKPVRFVELNEKTPQQYGDGNCFIVPFYLDEPGEYVDRYFRIENGEVTEIKPSETFFRVVTVERAEQFDGDTETGVITAN